MASLGAGLATSGVGRCCTGANSHSTASIFRRVSSSCLAGNSSTGSHGMRFPPASSLQSPKRCRGVVAKLPTSSRHGSFGGGHRQSSSLFTSSFVVSGERDAAATGRHGSGVMMTMASRESEGGTVMELEKGGDAEPRAMDEQNSFFEGADFLSDSELQTVVQDIAMIERQSDAVAQQMTEHARMLAEASKKLRARAQATRLEAAKLKKVARMQEAAEFRRREELRIGRARLEEDSKRNQKQQKEQVQMLQQQLQEVQMELVQQQQNSQQLQQQYDEQQERQQQEQQQSAKEDQASLQSQDQQTEAQETSQEEGESNSKQPAVKNGFAVPGIAALGAAVLPFAFPNGKHSGSAMDSALVSGPAVEGAQHTPEALGEAAVDIREGALVQSHHEGVLVTRDPSQAENGASHEPEEEEASEGGSEWAVTEDLGCEIAHPGAMSCTKVVVKKDAVNKVAVVSMETTVRCTGDGCLVESLDTEDFAALAMVTLAEQANELRHSSRFQGAPADADPRVQERRREIEELLAGGEVVGCKPIEPPSKFGHESFIVYLKNRHSKKEIKAMFKPRIDGDADGWHRAPVEWVAYELNVLLGMDYIPPVAYRKGGIDLGNGRKYKEGAFIFWVPGAQELKDVPAPSWGVSVARLLSDTRILDILLNNSDRHHGHFLFGEHWTDAAKRVVLIDHAAGFRKEASVTMEHENAFQTGAVRCVSAHTYLRLRFLDKRVVEEKFQDMLSPKEISGLMERKEEVLAYLDRLVQERGYHRTVVE